MTLDISSVSLIGHVVIYVLICFFELELYVGERMPEIKNI